MGPQPRSVSVWIVVVRSPRERPMVLQRPPFPLDAERCAFTVAEPMITRAGEPPALVMFRAVM